MGSLHKTIREMFADSDRQRDKGHTTPDTIYRQDNILYGEDMQWQILDVYRRKADKGKKLPVIISVHGGGWVYGDKDVYQYYCMDLARRGFAVINFTYRLAPENKFPAPVEDLNLVVQWMLQNAEKYNFDVQNVFGVGDSAGAHILGVYNCILNNLEYSATFTMNTPEDFQFRALGMNCGVYTVAKEHLDRLVANMLNDIFEQEGTDEEYARIDVVRYITEDFPPCHITTATGDFLRFQPAFLVEKLQENKVPFVYRFYTDEENGKDLGHVFHCNIRLPQATLCNDEQCDFFRMYIK